MTKNGLPPIHPGDYLAEILDDLKLTQSEFARSIAISPMRISHVVHGKRPVTAELALLFAKVFNQSPQYWLNLQTTFDLKTTEASMVDRLFAVRGLVPA